MPGLCNRLSEKFDGFSLMLSRPCAPRPAGSELVKLSIKSMIEGGAEEVVLEAEVGVGRLLECGSAWHLRFLKVAQDRFGGVAIQRYADCLTGSVYVGGADI